MLQNWKTTLVGLFTGGAISVDAVIHDGLTKGWKQALVGLAVAVLGALMADAKPKV